MSFRKKATSFIITAEGYIVCSQWSTGLMVLLRECCTSTETFYLAVQRWIRTAVYLISVALDTFTDVLSVCLWEVRGKGVIDLKCL